MEFFYKDKERLICGAALLLKSDIAAKYMRSVEILTVIFRLFILLPGQQSNFIFIYVLFGQTTRQPNLYFHICF